MTIQKYRGFEIHQADRSHCALIYRDGNLIKCIAGDILADGRNNAFGKAKFFIEYELKNY